MLDDALASLLSAAMLPALKPARSLTIGDRAPLGTFSARIDAAHQLGLISQPFAADLHVIRSIRNDFAHNPIDLTFAVDSIRDRIGHLDRSGFNRRFAHIRVNLGPPGPRGDFLSICSWMLFSLYEQAAKTQKPPVLLPEFGYFDLESAAEYMADLEPQDGF